MLEQRDASVAEADKANKLAADLRKEIREQNIQMQRMVAEAEDSAKNEIEHKLKKVPVMFHSLLLSNPLAQTFANVSHPRESWNWLAS